MTRVFGSCKQAITSQPLEHAQDGPLELIAPAGFVFQCLRFRVRSRTSTIAASATSASTASGVSIQHSARTKDHFGGGCVRVS